MGESLTGNCRAISYRFAPIVRMTNTYIEPRSASPEQMLGEMKSGLYVVGALGGMTELESFTFSSQYAWLVENGRKTKLIRDVILSGNIFDTLRRIDAIGNDLKLHGGLGGCGKANQSPLPVGDGGPHVRIRDVVIGGK
jgi:TldD protein